MECIDNLRFIENKLHLVNSIMYVWLFLLKYSSQCWILDAKSKIDKKTYKVCYINRCKATNRSLQMLVFLSYSNLKTVTF